MVVVGRECEGSGAVTKFKKESDQGRPPTAEAPCSRLAKGVVEIDDTPRNVARAFFEKRYTKFERSDDEELQSS